MGNVGSKRDNDEVVDELCSTTDMSNQLEMTMRIVDRGFFAEHGDPNIIYSLSPVNNGFIHISSPTIYAVALDALDITPGLKFLNVGSGSGYLSTIVGFLLGTYGANHGIELKQVIRRHSQRKVKEFKLTNSFFDMYDFCEPQFALGNAFSIDSAKYELFYDRIYCGANVSAEYRNLFEALLAPEGIMVMPCSGYFLKITKNSDGDVFSSAILDVTFAEMIRPSYGSTQVSLPKIRPPSLKSICRCKVREITRAKITVHIGHKYVPLRRIYTNPIIEEESDLSNLDEGMIFLPNHLHLDRNSDDHYENKGDPVPYRDLMAEFINKLPLHKPLRDYLMYYRML